VAFTIASTSILSLCLQSDSRQSDKMEKQNGTAKKSPQSANAKTIDITPHPYSLLKQWHESILHEGKECPESAQSKG
jgi:hypothetical protein